MHLIQVLTTLCFLCQFASSQVRSTKPLKSEWVKGPELNDKEGLLDWLLGMDESAPVERPAVDGFYNNLFMPEQGAFDTRMLRRSPAQYADGVFLPSGADRPNPFTVSRLLMSDDEVSPGSVSKTGKTALLVFFGQQLVEEVLDAQKAHCPTEYFNIPLPENNTGDEGLSNEKLDLYEYRQRTKLDVLPFVRTRYDAASGTGPNNPRQQLNELTPYIDGNLMYGTSPAWTNVLRRFANGTIAPDGQLAWSEDHGPSFPPINKVNVPMFNPPPPSLHDQFVKNHETLPASRHFMLGNPRGNENPMLLSFGILWFRWHNAIARHLAKKNPDWGNDQVFESAKKWVVASYQHLSTNSWIPEWLGVPLPPYEGYDASVNPQIDHMFQTAAMRFGHTLVLSGVYMRNFSRHGCQPIPVDIEPIGDRHSAGVRTCNSYWRPQDVVLKLITIDGKEEPLDIDRFFMGMATQMSEREDHLIVQDLRGFVFGPMEFSRRDLMAVNIQRGRDHAVSDYNTARKSMGLEPITDVDDYISKTGTQVPREVIETLFRLYGNNPENMDLWPAGLLETALNPGPLFRSVLIDQFTRIRAADRFWYKNYNNSLFTKEEVARLEQLTIYDVIMSVTRMEMDDIQDNPFLAPSGDLNAGSQKLSATCMSVLADHKSNTCIRQARLSEVIDHAPPMDVSFPCLVFNQTHLYRANSPSKASIEDCTKVGTYWYFSGSEIPFGITIGLEGITVIIAIVVVSVLLYRKQKQEQKEADQINKLHNRMSHRIPGHNIDKTFNGTEWMGRKEGTRTVNIMFHDHLQKIEVRDETSQLVRTINLAHNQSFSLVKATDTFTVVLKVPKEYDLVIKCYDGVNRNQLLGCWKAFVTKAQLDKNQRNQSDKPEKDILAEVTTHAQRRAQLRGFFRSVFDDANTKKKKMSPEIFMLELTREEFAEELRMKANSTFVVKMFDLMDQDGNGFISFREFRELLILFREGTADDKLKWLFDMYDTDSSGRLMIKEFRLMITSLVELSNANVDRSTAQNIKAIVDDMLSSVSLQNSNHVTFAEFKTMMGEHSRTLQELDVGFSGPDIPVEVRRTNRNGAVNRAHSVRQTFVDIVRPINPMDPSGNPTVPTLRRMTQNHELSGTMTTERPMKKGLAGHVTRCLRILDQYRLEVFWIVLHTFILWGVFFDQAYVYAVEREHIGFRQATGWGVSITRGAASAMMYSFVVILLTACRNVTSYLRDTILLRFIPFDSAFSFHQYVAWWGVFFVAVHTVGHGFNFYYLNTQPAADLACLFREHYFGTHILPKYEFWVWGTLTGVTGVLLFIQTVVIFVFSLPYVRRRLTRAFWITHKSYVFFYALNLLHGSARLIQRPYFPYWLAGPAALYAVDWMISMSRRRIFLPVIDAELLPSDVTKIVIQRPPGFEFRSGHYVRISCPALGDDVFHDFTLSSSPQADNLSVHIRAVGPWTRRLRKEISKAVHLPGPLPKVYLDGPYGKAHQDWCNYPVTVLVGAGIGVTPFASILQDIAHRVSTGEKLACKKVHFLWVTRDQNQFEWMVDLLRDVETRDTARLISTNIFITQFYDKFDIRTVMLYVCERQFQKIEQRSLFTGLEAITHFGHPDFNTIFKMLTNIHPDVSKFGVLSCGPRPLIRSVEAACRAANIDGSTDFRHQYETFN